MIRRKQKTLRAYAFKVFLLEATTGFGPVLTVLQTDALPLGYVAISVCLNDSFAIISYAFKVVNLF